MATEPSFGLMAGQQAAEEAAGCADLRPHDESRSHLPSRARKDSPGSSGKFSTLLPVPHEAKRNEYQQERTPVSTLHIVVPSAMQDVTLRPVPFATALLVGFVGAGVLAQKLLPPEHAPTIVLAVLLLSSLGLVVIWQEWRYRQLRHRAKFAQVVSSTHYVVHLLRDHLSDLDKGDIEDLRSLAESVLNQVARAFSIITSTRCRVTVKILTTPTSHSESEMIDIDTLDVSTLARDSATREVGRRSDRIYQLRDNSDFLQLVTDHGTCYVCNDIPKAHARGDYRNSSIPTSYEPGQPWPLNYRSAVVWPIRHRMTRAGEDVYTIMGFLCVDSPERHAFSIEYEYDLGALFADALFICLDTFNNATSTESGEIGVEHQ